MFLLNVYLVVLCKTIRYVDCTHLLTNPYHAFLVLWIKARCIIGWALNEISAGRLALHEQQVGEGEGKGNTSAGNYLVS